VNVCDAVLFMLGSNALDGALSDDDDDDEDDSVAEDDVLGRCARIEGLRYIGVEEGATAVSLLLRCRLVIGDAA
jgi:hypothetical protein